MSYYRWERIIDTGIREFGVSGILAIGQTGLYRPIENLKLDTNVSFSSGVTYYDGYLLLAPGIIVYSDINGNSSETKVDLRLNNGAFHDGMIVLGTEDGKILIGAQKLQFQEYPRTMKSINRINVCVDKFIIAGDNQISILWKENNEIKYTAIGSKYNFINAYVYRDKVFALSSDGYLNIFFVDENMKTNPSDVYRVNVRKALKDVEVNNMYVEATKTNDIYFLCSAGEVALIPDFNYTKETIDDIGDSLLLYAAKLTNDSFFKDMIIYGDKYIIVGHGEETKSCIQTTMLKTGIIEHNILNDIDGPERNVYNHSEKSGGTISDLRAIVTKTLPVYQDDHGHYIYAPDIIVNGFYTELIEAHDALDDNGWVNNKIYVRSTSTSEVVLSVDVNRRV